MPDSTYNSLAAFFGVGDEIVSSIHFALSMSQKVKGQTINTLKQKVCHELNVVIKANN